ncbi:hypothetical protein ACFWB1_01305 [Streptomyces goshikiensis]|uniref:hypothetical protein n=1 Tax=Streptomyces TaxID=1883 RepID=UPI00202ABFFF|nr:MULTISPECIES: hypothetical protein [unclassified Streptomyces]
MSPAVAPVALGQLSVIRDPEPSAPDEQSDGILTQSTRCRPRTTAAEVTAARSALPLLDGIERAPNTLDEIEYAPLRRVDQNPERTK